jgi:hypothetical protein
VTGWIFFNLLQVDPTASKFTVDELLFGFTAERRRKIPLVILWMLHTMKHIIWVARCDFRFRGKMPVELECLERLIVRIKFVLCLLGRKCKSPAQVRSFEKEWLETGRLGHFVGEKLVFSF